MSKLVLKLKSLPELREMDISGLDQELKRLRENQLKLRFLKKTQGFSQFDFFKKIRHSIASILMIKHQLAHIKKTVGEI